MIWLFLALALVTALAFLFMSASTPEAGLDPVAHYKAQLKELESDLDRGAIDATSAQAARLEIERRMLGLGAGHTAPVAMSSSGPKATWLLAALLLGGATGLYMLLGRPDLPSKPGVVVTGRQELVEPGGVSFDTAIRAIEAHLEQDPTDAKGWEVLAKSARAVRDFSTSARAFAELAELEPENTKWRIQQMEAMMAMAAGRITPATRLVLAGLLQSAPDHPAGQYYLGLTHLQDGKEENARAVWMALADRSSPDAPWMPSLRDRLSALGVGAPSISREDMAAVDAMSEEDRAAFIDSMIARLAERLESSPDDAEGWMMLARSHLSLGRREAAIVALERGIAVVTAQNRAQLQAFLDNVMANPDL